jgi:hypothetical protein
MDLNEENESSTETNGTWWKTEIELNKAVSRFARQEECNIRDNSPFTSKGPIKKINKIWRFGTIGQCVNKLCKANITLQLWHMVSKS